MLKPALLWIALAGLYLLLAGTVSATEIGSACVCAGLGLVWARAIRSGRPPLNFPTSSWRVVAKGFADIPRQMAEVGLQLLRAVLWGEARSTIRHRARWELAPGPAPSKGAQQSGLTAIGILAASLAPRSFVLEADHAHDRVVEHDFAPHTGEPG